MGDRKAVTDFVCCHFLATLEICCLGDGCFYSGSARHVCWAVYRLLYAAFRLEIGTIGIPWDSHGNGSDNDYIMGMGMGIKVWEWK